MVNPIGILGFPSVDNKSDIDDLGFVEAMFNQVFTDYLVDSNKVYSVG